MAQTKRKVSTTIKEHMRARRCGVDHMVDFKILNCKSYANIAVSKRIIKEVEICKKCKNVNEDNGKHNNKNNKVCVFTRIRAGTPPFEHVCRAILTSKRSLIWFFEFLFL